jgi:hypothetical protein
VNQEERDSARAAILINVQSAMRRSHERRRGRRSLVALILVAGGAMSLPLWSSKQTPVIDVAATQPSGRVRIESITTDELLNSFAEVHLAAAVLCEPTGGCTLRLLDSSIDRATVIH